MMLWCTTILRPGAARVAKLGEHVSLPRSVPLPAFIASIAGGAVGLIVGGAIYAIFKFNPITVFMLSAILFAVIGIRITTWQPWAGEHVGRVAWVKTAAKVKTKKVMCPGSGSVALWSTEDQNYMCATCQVLDIASDEGILPTHEWKRRLYVGRMEVVQPELGEVTFIAGSIPVQKPNDRQR